MSAALPAFLELPGDPVARTPLVLEGMRASLFVLPVDAGRLAAFVGRALDDPSQGTVDYRVPTPHVVLAVSNVESVRAAGRRDRASVARGALCGAWIPVVTRQEPDGTRGDPRLAFYAPVVAASDARLVASLRELFGWAVVTGRTKDEDGFARDPSAWPLGIELVDGAITIERKVDATASGASDVGWGESLLRVLSVAEDDATLLRRVAREGALSFVSLRQLRDAADPTRAAYAEIVELEARVPGISALSALPDGFVLRAEGAELEAVLGTIGIDARGHHVAAACTLGAEIELGSARRVWSSAGASRQLVHKAIALTGDARRVRVAVLGGGFAGLAAAFALSDTPELRHRYEVTVHQMGWRLGGRDRLPAGESLFGFYGNVFAIMRRCYEELGRGRESHVSRWEDVVAPRTSIDLGASGGEPWVLELGANHAVPGDGGDFPPVEDLVRSLVSEAPRLIDGVLSVNSMELPIKGVRALTALLRAAGEALRPQVVGAEERSIEQALAAEPVRDARDGIREWISSRPTEKERLKRAFARCDLALAMLAGILSDRVISNGLSSIDELDFVEWLKKHGASDTTIGSALLDGLLDLATGRARVSGERPNVAAGAALGFVLRFLYAYKGAVRWELRHDAGDAMFAPLYQCLVKRGVTISLFHRVTSLGLAKDHGGIDRVTLGRQVIPNGTYEALVEPDGTWPPQPLYEQLQDGDRLLEDDIDLEAPPPGFRDADEIELRRGDGFDVVVLTLPPSVLKTTCAELVEARREWRAMIDHLEMADDPRPGFGRTLVTRGSTATRLSATGSGFENLYLAGDWIDTGLNVGGLEASAIAGLQAARAISGHPAVVYGEVVAREKRRDPTYRVLADCPTCHIEGACVESVNPRVAQGAVVDSRCRFCTRHVSAGAVVAPGRSPKTMKDATEMLERWAASEGATDADAHVRASFRGAGIGQVAERIATGGGALVPTSFDPLPFLFPERTADAPPADAKDEEALTIARAMASVLGASGPVRARDEQFLSAFLATAGQPPLPRYDLRPWRAREMSIPRHPAAVLEALVVIADADRQTSGDEWRVLVDFARAWDFPVERLEHIDRTLDRAYAPLMRRLWLCLHDAMA